MIESDLRRRLGHACGFIGRHRWLEAIAIILVSAIVCGVGQELALFIFIKDNLSPCWPLAGLQAATLLRTPRRHWPWMIAGMVLAQIVVESFEPVDEMIADIVGDVTEVLIAALALPALNGLSDWLRQPHLLRRFIWWPMLLGPAITSFPVSAAFSHELHVSFWGYWARWFLGDMLGIAIWLPLGIVLMSRETYDLFTWKALPRTVGLIGMLSVASWGIFHLKSIPIAFVLLPLLLLIALKLGFSGSVIAVNILSIVCSAGTLRGLGPFAPIPEPWSVITLQIFLATSMLMCFPISIILRERDDFERANRDAYERMELLAITDGLTGVSNRRRFDAVFEDEWRRAMRDRDSIGLLMIDVDCFKLFNDFYGHLAGDDCLREIAEAVASKVKRAGDLVARYGGEEFVVLLPHTELAGVLELAEWIRFQVESLHLEHQGNPHKIVTISIGCATIIASPGMDAATLIEATDKGLYSAKQNGRNRIETLQRSPARNHLHAAS